MRDASIDGTFIICGDKRGYVVLCCYVMTSSSLLRLHHI